MFLPVMAKLKSSVSHDLSEIIIICLVWQCWYIWSWRNRSATLLQIKWDLLLPIHTRHIAVSMLLLYNIAYIKGFPENALHC